MKSPCFLIVAMLWVGVAVADEAQEAFDELFGKQVQAALKTRTLDDDVALARQLLDSGAKLKADEPVLRPLYEQAYKLARRAPQGYDTALEALRLLSQRFPDQTRDADDKALALIRTAYLRTRGDTRARYGEQLIGLLHQRGKKLLGDRDYKDAILTYREAASIARSIRSASADQMLAYGDLAQQRAAAVRRIAALEPLLDKPPVEPKVLDELVALCVAKLDDIEKAQSYALLLSAAMKQRLKNAAKPIEQIEPAQCESLGQWYSDLATPESGIIRRMLLERAEQYLAKYVGALAADQPKSIEALRAELALKKVRGELEKLKGLTGDKPKWTDLTPVFARILAQNKHESRNATVTFKKGVFHMEGEQARIKSPIEGKSVIFSVEIRKLSGRSASVAPRILDSGSYWTGLVDDNVVESNQWLRDEGRKELAKGTIPSRFDRGFVTIQMAVLGDTLITYINGREVLRAKSDKVAGPGAVGIGMRDAKAEFRNPKMLIPTPKFAEALLKKTASP